MQMVRTLLQCDRFEGKVAHRRERVKIIRLRFFGVQFMLRERLGRMCVMIYATDL